MVDTFTRERQELQAALHEESQRANRIQMELDAKESEIEQLVQKLALHSSDSMSVCSLPDSNSDDKLGTVVPRNHGHIREGGLC